MQTAPKALTLRIKMKGDVSRVCVGCGGQIHDQYILRVAPNLEWHAACLKCSECQKFLDENCTCFVREGKIFCKEDYLRLYGTKCEKCRQSFGKTDFVMRAKTKIFHLECFQCVACGKQLVPGDEFAMRNDSIYCKKDHQFSIAAADELIIKREENNNDHGQDGRDEDEDMDEVDFDADDDDGKSDQAESSCDRILDRGLEKIRVRRKSNIDSKMSSSGSETSSSGHNIHHHHHQQQQQRRSRAGRVRTVLTEKQLQLLKSCYTANPRPDALMKEQLVEMTGLSPRVIRVWFQNKRCKDKKKMQMSQNKEIRKTGYGSMLGIPLLATSPVRHDLVHLSQQNQVEIQLYEPTWKSVYDFAVNNDVDRMNPDLPHYQNSINQIHSGYDYRPAPLRPEDHYPHPSLVGHPPPLVDQSMLAMGDRPPRHDGDQLMQGDLEVSGYTLTSLESIPSTRTSVTKV